MSHFKVLLLLAFTTASFGYNGPIMLAAMDMETSAKVGIIGGEPVPITDVPYMASLRLNRNFHWCGASIVHEKFVLTAAHCIVPNRKYTVAVGTDNIGKGALYDVEKIIPHQRYTNVTHDFDICLVKLAKELTFGPNVSKIQVADLKTKLKPGMRFNATGWGYTQPNGNVSSVLRQVSVPFVKRRECQAYYLLNRLTGRMFCAGEDGKDTCTADSGGPLVKNQIQVGITSFGLRCGNGPAVYTKISVIEPWIRHTIARNI